MQTQSTEVTKKTPSDMAAYQPQTHAETILPSNVQIEKVLLMQGQSKYVKERKAQIGDIVRSLTGTKLGDDKNPIEFIPLTFIDTWRVEEIVGQKKVYKRTEPRNALNEHAPWDFEEGPKKFKRTKVVSVFALLPADIKAEQEAVKKFQATGEIPDVSQTLMPVVISFSSTSFKAGQGVVTHFMKALGMSKTLKTEVKAHNYKLVLSCYSDKNELGEFMVYKVATGKRLEPSELEIVDGWAKTMKTQAHTQKIHEDEEETVESVDTSKSEY